MSLSRDMYFSGQAIDELIEQEIEEKGFGLYREALDNIRLAMAIVYEKYAVDGKLDWGEMLKYKRLDHLEETIKQEMAKLNRRQQYLIKTILEKAYKEAYYTTAFSIEEED
jgi:hypothetical protein